MSDMAALIALLIDEEGYPPSAARRIAERLAPTLRRYAQAWNLDVATAVLAEAEAEAAAYGAAWDRDAAAGRVRPC